MITIARVSKRRTMEVIAKVLADPALLETLSAAPKAAASDNAEEE